MDRSHWQAQIAQVRRDNRSGAAEIASQALDLLTDVVRDSRPDTTVGYRQWLVRISHDVIATQPSMGVLFRLVNDMLWSCHEATGSDEIRDRVLSYLLSFRIQTDAALEALVESSCDHLASYSTIMTYSRSSTVVRVLTAMAERGCKVRVYCSEGRPMLEGQTLANELGWAGLDVTMGIDMALFGWLSDTKALLLGADSIAMSGLVNKIGTTQLALAAQRLGIPCIVVCTTHKMLPNDYLIGQSLRAGDPEEIMPVSNENTTVGNAYFDMTPLDLFDTVITEEGPLGRAELVERLEAVRTYPGLRGR